jgi:DNA-binding MarR family transcriptional regulator
VNILHAIHRADQTASALFVEHAKVDMTLRQAIVLAAVKAAPGCAQVDLVDATGIDRSTLADMVRRLVAKGWLKRVKDQKDTRAYVVTLTPEGTRALSAATSATAKAEKALIATYPGVRHLANGATQ